jgi:Na+-translocating ferredoxin:NAD+ oxidoreductase subunit B
VRPVFDLLVDQIDAALPQTQCTRCGEPDCRAYAAAIASGAAPINRCPPGGVQGIERLAAITGLAALPLDPAHGVEAERGVARIDEAWCIGCTLCIKACPVEAILGAPKQMHVVIEADCTGCELCIPVCPVDCIDLPSVTPGLSGWSAWSPDLAQGARTRYVARQERQQRESTIAAQAKEQLEAGRKKSVVEAALARAKAKARP